MSQANVQGGLAALSEKALSPENKQLLDKVSAVAAGSPVWRARKLAEARDLLALSQLASRLTVLELDGREALRALVELRVPVPCLPAANGDLQIADRALLGLTYPEEAIRRPQPGYAFVQIIAPSPVWLANVTPDFRQLLCLGASLPAGIRVKELLLMTYGALTMQTVQIDETDGAGVLNHEAALWWQQNLHRVPLSRVAFLAPVEG